MAGQKQVCGQLSSYVLNHNGASAYAEYRLIIYIGIEQLRLFKEVSVGEMFGSVGEQTSLLK
jgi:hypothetical protein